VKINRLVIFLILLAAVSFSGIGLLREGNNLYAEDKTLITTATEKDEVKKADEKEAEERKEEVPEISTSSTSGVKEEVNKHLKGTGLQFSLGAPGGARPVERAHEGYPDFPPLRIIPPEKESETK